MDLGFGQSRCWVVRTSLFQKAIRAISNLAPNCGYDPVYYVVLVTSFW